LEAIQVPVNAAVTGEVGTNRNPYDLLEIERNKLRRW
jgi:hypothetical protein